MANTRKYKKFLKKVYKEAVIKNTLSIQYGDITTKLIVYKNESHSLINFKPIDIPQISNFTHDAFNNEWDEINYKNTLIKKNKRTPYPNKKKRVKKEQLKFTHIYC